MDISDFQMRVRWRRGDEIEEDVNCNGQYMIDAMEQVGTSAREVFWWVDISERMYIVMDNAGGHGSKEAIEDYRSMLLNRFNIQIIFQTPCSLFLNLLDLGVWCSLQAKV